MSTDGGSVSPPAPIDARDIGDSRRESRKLSTGDVRPVGTPKRKNVAKCSIRSHTIEKNAMPKKNALDPTRYIPDRPNFYALFTLVVVYDDSEQEHYVDRTHKQFLSLQRKLHKKYPKSPLPKMPSMHRKRYDNEYIRQKTQELNQYLSDLIQVPEIRSCKLFREFLEDSNLPDDSEEDEEDIRPSGRPLDATPGTIVTVRAGQSFSLSLTLRRPGDVATWQFTTKKHDIGFSATFEGETVNVYSREESNVKPIKGRYQCSSPGVLSLTWDNTYTWSKGKVLVYWAEVLPIDSSDSPRKDAVHESFSTPQDDEHPPPDVGSGFLLAEDGRRAGYIDQSRNHGLYPRQIVNSSLTLLSKPFVTARRNELNFQAGSLIIQRSVKFRGKSWYRKWFVLDKRKAALRYYDSEHAARRGLSLAKLRLTAKDAQLAVTSSGDDEAAPTPYMFMVQSQKRTWKICTDSLEQYNLWEREISTAILWAQQQRRRRKGKRGTVEPISENAQDVEKESDESDDSSEEDVEAYDEHAEEHDKLYASESKRELVTTMRGLELKWKVALLGGVNATLVLLKLTSSIVLVFAVLFLDGLVVRWVLGQRQVHQKKDE